MTRDIPLTDAIADVITAIFRLARENQTAILGTTLVTGVIGVATWWYMRRVNRATQGEVCHPLVVVFTRYVCTSC